MNLQLLDKEEAKELVFEESGNILGWESDRYYVFTLTEHLTNRIQQHPENYMHIVESLEEISNSHFVQQLPYYGTVKAHMLFRKFMFLGNPD